MTGGLAIETAGRMVLMADDVELTSDALATWAMMVGEANSTLLGSIHGVIVTQPTYIKFVARGNLSLKHRWGLSNEEGDGVSRGYVDQVRDRCSAGGLRYQPQTLSDESDGWVFILQCLDRIDMVRSWWLQRYGAPAAAEPEDYASTLKRAREAKERCAVPVLVNCRSEDYDIYVGRLSAAVPWSDGEWGNRHHLRGVGRDAAVCLHAADLLADAERALHARATLQGSTLGCWCSPERCHGEALLYISNCSKAAFERYVGVAPPTMGTAGFHMAPPREVVDAVRTSPAGRRGAQLEGGRTRAHTSSTMGDGPTAPLGLGVGGLLCGIAGWALCAALAALAAMRRAVDWVQVSGDGSAARGLRASVLMALIAGAGAWRIGHDPGTDARGQRRAPNAPETWRPTYPVDDSVVLREYPPQLLGGERRGRAELLTLFEVCRWASNTQLFAVWESHFEHVPPPPELAGQWGQYGHVIEHGIVRLTTPDEIRETLSEENFGGGGFFLQAWYTDAALTYKDLVRPFGSMLPPDSPSDDDDDYHPHEDEPPSWDRWLGRGRCDFCGAPGASSWYGSSLNDCGCYGESDRAAAPNNASGPAWAALAPGGRVLRCLHRLYAPPWFLFGTEAVRYVRHGKRGVAPSFVLPASASALASGSSSSTAAGAGECPAPSACEGGWWRPASDTGRRVAARHVAPVGLAVSAAHGVSSAAPRVRDEQSRLEMRAATRAAEQSIARSGGRDEVAAWTADTAQLQISALQADDTEGRLEPEDWSLHHNLLARCGSARDRARPRSTKKKDKSYWKFWKIAMKALGAAPVRSNSSAVLGHCRAGHEREKRIVEMVFMLWANENPQYKPSSMMARLHGVSRVHRLSMQLPFVSLSTVVALCKGIVQEQIDDHGPESIEVKRREPLQNWMLIRWLELPMGTSVGPYTVGDNLPWQGVRTWICYHASTGSRKADVALDDGVKWGLRHLSMWHACYEIRGVRSRHITQAQYEALDEQCLVHFKPVPCKNDPDGTRWSATPTTCRWHSLQTVNLAREFAKYDQMRALAPELRRGTPMFVNHLGDPWRKGKLAWFFKQLLLAIMSAEEAALYTIHSFRIYLACALLAAGASKEMIKKMLRWASDEALNIYARDNADVIASWLDAARQAEVTSVRSSSLPDVHGVTLPSAAAFVPPAVSAADRTWMAARPAEEALGSEDPIERAQAVRIATAIAADDIPSVTTAEMAEMADWMDSAREADVRSVAEQHRPVVDNDLWVAGVAADMRTLERMAAAEKDADASFDAAADFDAEGDTDSPTSDLEAVEVCVDAGGVVTGRWH